MERPARLREGAIAMRSGIAREATMRQEQNTSAEECLQEYVREEGAPGENADYPGRSKSKRTERGRGLMLCKSDHIYEPATASRKEGRKDWPEEQGAEVKEGATLQGRSDHSNAGAGLG